MCVASAPARVGTRYMDALGDEKCKTGKGLVALEGKVKKSDESEYSESGVSL
jgi:hypothetical protein